MCGIVGYTGGRQAAPLLLEGLKRLEYRGYDSAGLALVADGRIEVHEHRQRTSPHRLRRYTRARAQRHH